MAIPDDIKDVWDRYFGNKTHCVPAETPQLRPEPQPENPVDPISRYKNSGLYRNARHPNINREEFHVSENNAVRYRDNVGKRMAIDVTAADNIFLTSSLPLDENFLLLVEKKNGAPGEAVASGKLVRKYFQENGQTYERYCLEIPGKRFQYVYAGDYFLIVACPGANLGNDLE